MITFMMIFDNFEKCHLILILLENWKIIFQNRQDSWIFYVSVDFQGSAFAVLDITFTNCCSPNAFVGILPLIWMFKLFLFRIT